jgi:hypothetical protein
VTVQLALLVLRQLPVGRHPRRPLDQGLGEGDADGVAFLVGADQGDIGSAAAACAGLEQGPLGLVSGLVQVDGLDAAERLAVMVDKGAALPAVGDLWSRKCHRDLQLYWGEPFRRKGWPATERPPAWLAASYRCWLTIEPSRKPAINANDRSRVRPGPRCLP